MTGDPRDYRFRSQRRAGISSLRRTITIIAEPRSPSTGTEQSRRAGTQFIGSPAAIPNAGDPTTGKRYAIWDHFLWDSSSDLWGA